MAARTVHVDRFDAYLQRDERVFLIYDRGAVVLRRDFSFRGTRPSQFVGGQIHFRDLPRIWDLAYDQRISFITIPFFKGGTEYHTTGWHRTVSSMELFLDEPECIRDWLRETVGRYLRFMKMHRLRRRQTDPGFSF